MPSSKPPALTSPSPTSGVAKVVILYAGFSALWILLSDQAVEWLVKDPVLMTRISIAKGWIFVAVTAALLFVLVKGLVGNLANREAKLRTLLNSLPDLVWLKDPEGGYLGCNLAYERFFGVREQDIVGKTAFDFVPKEAAEAFRGTDQEAIQAQGAKVTEISLVHPRDGRRVILETVKAPIFDDRNGLIGVLGIGRDVTEHHRLMQEEARLNARLLQSQKLESVGRFAGSVAHDYNNMLSVILASADLALEKVALDHPARGYLEEIVRAATHSGDLTRELLTFSRSHPREPRAVDLNEAIEGMRRVLERLAGPGIEVAWKAAEGLWSVRVDPTQLDQILTNLVANARDAIGGLGRIRIVAKNLYLSEEDCAAIPDGLPGEQVRIRVEDDGCGMAPEVMANIFEPFFTTKRPGKGTGLGLAMVHSAVKQNQGAIRVESQPGEGSAFSIYLPRA